jgi:hypothetical protein
MCRDDPITLHLALTAASAASMSALAESLERVAELLDARVELLEAGVGSVDALAQLARLDLDVGLTSRAADGRALLEPTDGLRELALAVGAGQVDLGVVEIHGHGGTRA